MFNIIFFGTSKFSYKILEKLHQISNQCNLNIILVICQADKPAKRGKQMYISPVKTYAQINKLNLYKSKDLYNKHNEPNNLLNFFRTNHIDLSIVASYGKIIPQYFFKYSKFGFMNVHTSLLPRWRGAAPIQRAIKANDKKTGISYIDLTAELDAGDIYKSYEICIQPNDNAEQLSNKLTTLAINTIEHTILGILNKTIKKIPQKTTGITYANKIKKLHGCIKWHTEPHMIINNTRAMHPWPGSYTFYQGKIVKLFNAQNKQYFYRKQMPGTILNINNILTVSCKNGSISFDKIQLEGKKCISIKEFANGYNINVGDYFHISRF